MRQDGFLKLLQASHCILDSLYVSGGMSSAETLGVGKAVVTLPHASRAVGRVTYGYYRQIGVTECIAQSPADYVAIALRLGTDPQWRSEIETKIRAHAHLLHERKEVIHELEAFFERALARRPTGAPADSISIPE
jgi:predicted O-linked N-acetylglucosamine transferase (SPINDLY family)